MNLESNLLTSLLLNYCRVVVELEEQTCVLLG